MFCQWPRLSPILCGICVACVSAPREKRRKDDSDWHATIITKEGKKLAAYIELVKVLSDFSSKQKNSCRFERERAGHVCSHCEILQSLEGVNFLYSMQEKILLCPCKLDNDGSPFGRSCCVAFRELFHISIKESRKLGQILTSWAFSSVMTTRLLALVVFLCSQQQQPSLPGSSSRSVT